MVINIVMTLLFGYVYLSIFTAFFIGNIRNPVGFFIIYGLHIAFTVGAIVVGFFIEIDLFLPQVHFILNFGDWYGAVAVQFIQPQ